MFLFALYKNFFDMYKEYVDKVIDMVAKELEISKEDILSKSRSIEILDARNMVVRLLWLMHVYPKKIADLTHLSTRNIHYIITTFDDRVKGNRFLRQRYAKIAKELCRMFEISDGG